MSTAGAVLPDAPWRQHPGLIHILSLMADAGLSVRIVGGAVRDALAGVAVTDVDLATPALPAEVTHILSAGGIKVVPTGIKHGTLTLIAGGKPYEITTLRRDVATDGRRATVAFSTDWHEDAARRDFTINALYADPDTGAIQDYFGGCGDLVAGCVRFIGDAATRIAEDHLRILRYYRFAARFGHGPVDAASHDAVIAARASLRTLSRERVADELMKLLALPDPAPTLAMMGRDGVLAEILPEAGSDGAVRVASLVAAEMAAAARRDPARRLAALLASDAVMAAKAAARLKLSNRLRKRIAAALAVGPLPSDRSAVQQAAYRCGLEAVEDALLIGDDPAGFAMLKGWTVPRFPLRGADVLARGVSAGPSVARMLKTIEDKWIAAGFPDRDWCLDQL
jgi:poly(A) polymerase